MTVISFRENKQVVNLEYVTRIMFILINTAFSNGTLEPRLSQRTRRVPVRTLNKISIKNGYGTWSIEVFVRGFILSGDAGMILRPKCSRVNEI